MGQTPRSDADWSPGRFEPHPWLRGGHAQTIVGRYWPSGDVEPIATEQIVPLADGDALVVLETIPAIWSPGDPSVVLVHGLAGCARSPYLTRVAARLVNLGIRVERLNLRNAGAGFGLARGIYHCGRSADLRAVLDWLHHQTPRSPLALLGFSLGASLTLKLAAEAAESPVAGLDCVLAANPPIDLEACCRYLQRPGGRIYDRHLVVLLQREIRRLHRRFPDLETPPAALNRVTSLFQFDDVYTAPRNGFADALDYYRQCSTHERIPRITLPGLVVHAADDPFIDVEPFHQTRFPARLKLELQEHGGHLGYFGRADRPLGRRWLDARLTEWLANHWALVPGDGSVIGSGIENPESAAL